MSDNDSAKLSFKFPKEERLHHKSLVDGVFLKGKSFYEFPFRVSWRGLSEEELDKNFRNKVPEGIAPVQMMVTVPKKKRRRAVDRVRMRRLIREAYRLNKGEWISVVCSRQKYATVSLALVYIHNENLPYSIIEEKMKLVLSKLLTKLSVN